MGRQDGSAPTRRKMAAADTRQRIVEAARRLFGEHGFDAVTTEQIARAAGIAKATLFLHARTKERLLVLVYEEEFGAALREALARPPGGGTVAAALTAVFRRFARVHETDPALARRFVQEILSLKPDDAPALREVQDHTLRRLAALIGERSGRATSSPPASRSRRCSSRTSSLAPIYLFSLLAMGLLVSSRSATQIEAVQAAQSILLPSIFLSGYVFPISSLPHVLQLVSRLLPATHFIAIARGIVIRGAGFADLWGHVAALVGLSLLLVVASTRAFRKTVS